MIKKINLKNIKCFQDVTFEFAPLTVFCGANSAGKSTAIQCLLLLKQSFDIHSFEEKKLNLSGPLFSVGHVQDLVAQQAISDTISIKVDDSVYESQLLKNIDQNSYLLPLKSENIGIHPFLNNAFHYLNAYRLSPQNSYDVNFDSDKIDFGIYGQYAVAELERLRLEPALNQNLARKTVLLTQKLLGTNINE
ncbi:TPA: AAA family ATPase, partial [Klebsiella pneumoniae subsp. pneumoniae]|nr:AAA family ATPase [Klebsiella pneumoniae subsp. pneumoniae]